MNIHSFFSSLARSYAYMIDNVVLLISGTLHERDTHDLLERCHPLGTFDTMPALCVATNVEELYSTVLVETPLGKLQSSFIAEL
jgi:V-type H+-transporting ATPase subunit d